MTEKNVTGMALLAPELNGKRLALSKQAFPKITRVAFLWRPGSVWATTLQRYLGIQIGGFNLII